MGMGSPVLPTDMTEDESLPDEGGTGADGHCRVRQRCAMGLEAKGAGTWDLTWMAVHVCPVRNQGCLAATPQIPSVS